MSRLPLRVACLTHSYGRGLESVASQGGNIDGRPLDFRFFYKSGKCFEYFIDWPSELHDLVEFNPSIVFIALGGNSIKDSIRVKHLAEKANILLKILRNNLAKAKLVVVQVERRFLKETNRFGTPPAERFRLIRNKLNKALQASPNKDFMCCIAGANRLDSEKYFCADKIHLNDLGYKYYVKQMVRTIQYVMTQDKTL